MLVYISTWLLCTYITEWGKVYSWTFSFVLILIVLFSIIEMKLVWKGSMSNGPWKFSEETYSASPCQRSFSGLFILTFKYIAAMLFSNLCLGKDSGKLLCRFLRMFNLYVLLYRFFRGFSL